MPRIFTRAELTHTITTGNYKAMSPTDRQAYDRQLFALWEANARGEAYIAGDYDLLDTRQRHEFGA